MTNSSGKSTIDFGSGSFNLSDMAKNSRSISGRKTIPEPGRIPVGQSVSQELIILERTPMDETVRTKIKQYLDEKGIAASPEKVDRIMRTGKIQANFSEIVEGNISIADLLETNLTS